MLSTVENHSTFVCRVQICFDTNNYCTRTLVVVPQDFSTEWWSSSSHTIEVKGWTVEVPGGTEQTCYKLKIVTRIAGRDCDLWTCNESAFYGCHSACIRIIQGDTSGIEKSCQLYNYSSLLLTHSHPPNVFCYVQDHEYTVDIVQCHFSVLSSPLVTKARKEVWKGINL
jgi:hypothetical protein